MYIIVVYVMLEILWNNHLLVRDAFTFFMNRIPSLFEVKKVNADTVRNSENIAQIVMGTQYLVRKST